MAFLLENCRESLLKGHQPDKHSSLYIQFSRLIGFNEKSYQIERISLSQAYSQKTPSADTGYINLD